MLQAGSPSASPAPPSQAPRGPSQYRTRRSPFGMVPARTRPLPEAAAGRPYVAPLPGPGVAPCTLQIQAVPFETDTFFLILSLRLVESMGVKPRDIGGWLYILYLFHFQKWPWPWLVWFSG